jgi:D-alanyl-D-alanine carboxypeptidase
MVAGLATLCVAAAPADARRHYRHATVAEAPRPASHHSVRESGYSPPYAAIVVDANTGRTLEEKNADSLRHPASLTKIMTLYLLFERLDAGKMKLSNMMPVSAHAADQAPTKLGLKPGQSLNVEDAIRGLVTRSANDAAVVIAETIGGDEDSFAKMMTAKARALGMSRTTYVNASGLPADDQVTTARDQAILGRAIQERFPRYYTYFSTSSFHYRGEDIRNHNHLLGRVEGVDGIKTGYTRASGFNLVTSLHRNNRYIVAVVLGGSSAGARDARMRELIEEHVAEASTKRTATMIAEAEPAQEPATRSLERPARTAERPAPAAAAGGGYGLASASAQPVAAPATPVQAALAPKPKAVASEPIRPIAVKTIKVKLAPVHTASLAPAAAMIPVTDETSAPADAAPAPAAPAPAAPAAASVPSAPAAVATVANPEPAAATALPPQAPAPEPAVPAQVVKVEPAKVEPPAPPAPPTHNVQAHSGWIIQIGAYGSETEAKQHLDVAQSKAKTLSRADRFTETVTKGDKTFYRARFAGLEKDQAEATCRQLRRSDIACMTVKN